MINLFIFRPETFFGHSLFILLVAVEILAIYAGGVIISARRHDFAEWVFECAGDAVLLVILVIVLLLTLLPALVLPDVAVAVMASVIEIGCVVVALFHAVDKVLNKE